MNGPPPPSERCHQYCPLRETSQLLWSREPPASDTTKWWNK
jgi:hypothetical protein